MATVGTPDYITVSGTVAAMATFSAAVDAQVVNGYAPLGHPQTDGTGIWQVMFRGAVASFIAEYPILAVVQVPTSGSQTLSVAPSRLGTDLVNLTADTYDFDFTVDGGPLQQLSITITGGEDYNDVAALLDAVVILSTVTFTGSAFVFTSPTTGSSSSILVEPGTLGSSGGDLFAAIEAADTVTITFQEPVDGTDLDAFEITGNQTKDFNAGYRFTVTRSTGNNGVYTVADGGSTSDGLTTLVFVSEQIPSAVGDGFIEAYAPSVGP